MECPFCGESIDGDHPRFCPQCGTLLVERPAHISSNQTGSLMPLHSVPTRISVDAQAADLYDAPTHISADAQAAAEIRWRKNDSQPVSPPPIRSSVYVADVPPREHPTAPTHRSPMVMPPPSPRAWQRGRVLIFLALVVLSTTSAGVVGYAFGRSGIQTTGMQSPTALVPRSLTPTATAIETVVFSDPLTSATPGHPWPQDSADCFFQGGSYHILTNYICLAPVGITRDANISVQVKQLTNSSINYFGIVFRYRSAQDFYEFRINSNSLWFVDRYSHGTPTTLVTYTANAALKPGLSVVNTLLVRAHGAHFQFFANGVELGQLDDPTYASGEIGLRGASPGPADVAWSNFQMTSSSY